MIEGVRSLWSGLVKPPAGARYRLWARGVVVGAAMAVVLAASLTVLQAELRWLPAIVAAGAGLGVALAELTYRGFGHELTSSFVISRSGGFAHSIALLPLERVQAARISSSLRGDGSGWHR